MSIVEEFKDRAAELIEAGRFIHTKGWVPATSGNFSAKLSDGTIAITVSGKHKGELTEDDIMRVDADGESLDGKKPSAETLLHTAIYRRYPDVGSVLHPHSPNATLVSRLFRTELVLEDFEILKALEGIETHQTRITIPIFPNDQNIRLLSERVDEYIDRHGDVHGYIIAGHGYYTWGRNVKNALQQVEALDFLFDIEVRLYGVKPL
jgi:methylthioribulose-1-phosphate dehydratase